MSRVSFTETMDGWFSFDERDYTQAMLDGRRDRRAIGFELTIAVDDVDAFVDDPAATVPVTGALQAEELGGELPVERGDFNLFVQAGDRVEMRYRLRVRDRDGRPLTLIGFKQIRDDPGYDVWTDTTTLFFRLVAGHVDHEQESAEGVVGSGILTIGWFAFLRQMATMRGSGLPRFGRLFAGELFRVYAPRMRWGGQPEFPDARGAEAIMLRGRLAGEWHEVPGHPALRRRILPFRAGDGYPCTLHNVRGEHEPTRGPVLMIHGTGVRGDIFLGARPSSSLAGRLVAEGYDVWLENWRASIDLPPHPYSLDEGAAFDHPAAIARVLEETGAETLKAVVHCQGSTSFVVTALAGLAPQVTDVVSSAVSLHPMVPFGCRVKMRFVSPFAAAMAPGLSAQWGARAPTPFSAGLARWARLLRRECDDPVCAVANYMYGTGPDVLWVHDQLDEEIHTWCSREFGWVPFKFFKQIQRSTRAGHLVPTDDRPAILPSDYVAEPARIDARWTFLAGSKNRAFLPSGQRRSFEWFERQQPGRHAHVELDGYGHLDPIYGEHAGRDVHPLIVAALDQPVTA